MSDDETLILRTTVIAGIRYADDVRRRGGVRFKQRCVVGMASYGG